MTGTRKSGKSTLLSQLFPHPLPGITTWAEPGRAVYLRENMTGKTVRIGAYEDGLPGTENKMTAVVQGFETLGKDSLKHCEKAEGEWISIDEIGYLEAGCPDYCGGIRKLMEKKRVAAVIRKQSLDFLGKLCSRDDVFLVDLDSPFGSQGCVIMASGLGKRFGGNKLMVDFKGKPMIQWVLDATENIFTRRVVVTRHKTVEALCQAQGIDVIYHTLSHRNDTLRLGLLNLGQDVEGCVFCPGDQPLLRRDTIASLALCGANEKNGIWRTAYEDRKGAPVLFPKWSFPQLLSLPEGKGGSFVAEKYPEQVRTVSVRDPYELMDADTPEDLKGLEEQPFP